MDQRFTTLETLDDDSISSLLRATDAQAGKEVFLRRFKTTDDAAKEGLQSLFRALKELAHGNIEPVREVGVADEHLFVVTDAPQGDTLPEVLEQGPLSAEEFSMLTEQSLQGLAAVHDQALMHGSLRAEHVRIDRSNPKDWKVRIHGFGQGFGSAKEGEEPSPEVYLCAAPEQWEAGQARRRTDVYALGCLLYQAAAARAPFAAKTLKELRHKHLNHDVRPLAKLAPQLPSWASAWVMRLLAVEADARPRKAGVAMELYHQKDSAPDEPSAPRTEKGKITQTVATAGGPPSPQGTRPLKRSTASVIASSGRPEQATSGTIAVPLGQTGQASIPSALGRPVRSRTPSSKPAAKSSVPLPLLLIGGAVIAVVGLILLFSGGDSASVPTEEIKWGKVREFPMRIESQPPRSDALPYPNDRPAPVAAERLLLHYRADEGIEDFSGKQGTRPASPGGYVAAWNDLGKITRNNELAHFPWVPERTGIKLVSVDPTPANGLMRSRLFVEFESRESPPSCLNLSARGDPNRWPFGSTAKPGLTVACVFMHRKVNYENLLLSLRGKQGALTIRFDKQNNLKLLAGQFGQDLPPEEKASPITSRDVNCAVPSVVICRWRASPQRVSYTLVNAKNQRFESLTEARNFPTQGYDGFCLGGGPTYAYSNPKAKIFPFRGGIAEVFVYPDELSDADVKTLESELTRYYFK